MKLPTIRQWTCFKTTPSSKSSSVALLRQLRTKVIVFSLIVLSVIGLIKVLPTHAANASLYVAGDDTFSGNETNVYLQLSGSASAGGACGGICGITTVLSYDSSKLALASATPSQGFDFVQGSTLVLYKASAASDGTVLILNFRNVGLSSGESTTVTFSNITTTNGDADSLSGAASKTITYSPSIPTPEPQPTPEPSPEPTHEPSSTPSSSDVGNSKSTTPSAQNNPEVSATTSSSSGDKNVEETANVAIKTDDSRIAGDEAYEKDENPTAQTGNSTKESQSSSKISLWSVILVAGFALTVPILFYALSKMKHKDSMNN